MRGFIIRRMLPRAVAVLTTATFAVMLMPSAIHAQVPAPPPPPIFRHRRATTRSTFPGRPPPRQVAGAL